MESVHIWDAWLFLCHDDEDDDNDDDDDDDDMHGLSQQNIMSYHPQLE